MVESPDFFRVKSDMSPSEFGLKSDLNFALGYLLQDLGIVLMLGRMNARLEIAERVVGQHGDLVLEDNRALVVLLVREVNGDSRHLITRFEGILNSVGASMRRQQCRMEVDDAIGVRVEQHGRDLAHVAGHRRRNQRRTH